MLKRLLGSAGTQPAKAAAVPSAAPTRATASMSEKPGDLRPYKLSSKVKLVLAQGDLTRCVAGGGLCLPGLIWSFENEFHPDLGSDFRSVQIEFQANCAGKSLRIHIGSLSDPEIVDC